jgi:protein-disulfide isomerase
MEKQNMDTEEFVSGRMAALKAGGEWTPDVSGALSRLRGRERSKRAGWTWGAVAATVGGLAMLMLPARGDCAQPFMGMVCLNKAGVAHFAAVADTAPMSAANYKQTGNPSAPVTLEIYSDYQCPACARFYTDTYPQLYADYVKTGKVKLIHRDFPLPQHPHAREAANFANAAGEAGGYDAAVMQCFKTQTQWEANGNIEGELAKVLTPGVMQKVRARVAHPAGLDKTVNDDVERGVSDRLDQTPTMIIVARGKRQKVAPIPAYNFLKSYLDQVLNNK